MDDGHRPTRSPRSELLAKFSPVISWCGRLTNGGMIEPGRIDCDLVPTLDRACRVGHRPWPTTRNDWTMRGTIWISPKPGTKRVPDPTGKPIRQNNTGGS